MILHFQQQRLADPSANGVGPFVAFVTAYPTDVGIPLRFLLLLLSIYGFFLLADTAKQIFFHDG